MSETVEATVMDTELATLSGLDVMVADITARAQATAAQYSPHAIENEQDFKDSKKARSEARKAITAIRADYKERMQVIRDAVAEADARVREALGPLDAIDEGYKLAITAYDNAWTAARVCELQDEYEGYAPALVDLVPFARLNERFGQETGSKWLLRSTNIEVARALLRKACDTVAEWEQRVTASVEAQDLEGAKADLFRTLDPDAAIRAAHERAAGRQRVRELEEQRRAALIDTRPVMTYDEYLDELQQVSAPTQQQTDMRREVARALTDRMQLLFMFDKPLTELTLNVTAAELEAFKTILRANDVHGKMRRIK